MMLVDPATIAIQAATETMGAAATGAGLATATPGLLSLLAMGGDEDTIAFAATVVAHGAQYLLSTGLNVLQRGMLGGAVGDSGIEFAATEAANQTGLTGF
jgi:PE family